jgi:hypothetical protein
LNGVVSVIGHWIILERAGFQASPLFAMAIDETPFDDRRDKRCFGSLCGVEAFRALPNREKGVLRSIFGVGVIGTVFANNRPNQTAIRGEAIVHRRSISCRNTL